MLYLPLSTDKIEIVLGGTVTATELDWTAIYHKHLAGQSQIREDAIATGTSNGTTDVEMVPGPDETVYVHYEVSELHIYNNDSASADVTIKIDRNGTETILHEDTLAAGETLQYINGAGFVHGA